MKDTNHNDNNNSNNSTWWDLFLSLYLPVLLVWVRRGMFGTASLFRSLILGHCLRFLFSNVSVWVTEKSPLWLHPVLLLSSYSSTSPSSLLSPASSSTTTTTTPMSSSTSHGVVGSVVAAVDPHAWPPPALTVLAILTIVALVVHPDGFTWIMLGKLRSVDPSSRPCFNERQMLRVSFPFSRVSMTFAVSPIPALRLGLGACVYIECSVWFIICR